jgi:hypothetical protein
MEEVNLSTIATISAIYISAPTISALNDARKAIEKYLPATYELPCGEKVTFESSVGVPLYDVPCSCGNPSHWFVKVRIDPSLDRKTQHLDVTEPYKPSGFQKHFRRLSKELAKSQNKKREI